MSKWLIRRALYSAVVPKSPELEEGWEPFAVTVEQGANIIWWRKPKDA